MVYVQFQYTLKKKKILIQGQVENKTFDYINLLLEINKRWYLDKVVDWLMRVFKYDGEEIGSVCVVAVAVIVTEILSYVWFSPVNDPAITVTSQYKHSTFSHITLILCIILSTTLTTFCRFTYRLYLCIVLQIILALIYCTLLIKQIEDYGITLSLLIVCSVCLLITIYKRLINSKQVSVQNQNKIINGFEFQSSIVIGVYVVGKLKYFWQLYGVTNGNMQLLQPLHLIPFISCILIITLLKIWSLFEFNPYYLVSLLTSIHNEQNQQLQKMSYFENFLIFGQHLASRSNGNSNQNDNNNGDNGEQQQVVNPLYLDNDNNNDYNNQQQQHYEYQQYQLPQPIKIMDNVHEEEYSQQQQQQQQQGSCSAINKPQCGFQQQQLRRQNVQQQQQQQQQNVGQNKSISQISSPYTTWIWLPIVLNVVHFIVILCLILFNNHSYTYTEIFIMSLGLYKPLILMLYSQHYNILMSQHQSPTHSYYHLLYLISDCFLALPIIICVLLIYNNLIPLTNTYHLITILVNCYAPFHTKTIYRSLAKKMNITMSNHSMVHFYLIWMGLFQYRETIVIFSQQYFPSIYIIIDIILCTYAIFIILIMSKVQFYSQLYKQIKFILNMKNYKFYITQSMKSWQFDITQTSQILYYVNLLLLFTGYVVYKFNRQNKQIVSDGNYHQVVYLIVMLFAIAIHLLHSYNNFHTERLVVVKMNTHKQEQSNDNNQNNQTKKNSKNPSTFNWYPPCWNYAILNIAILSYGTVVFLLYYFGSSNDSNILHNQQYYSKHMTYSVVAIICSIFATFVHAFMQQIYVSFTHFHSPLKLINLLISYFLFYFPFITLFALLYFNLNLEQQYIFYFAIGGFAYLTIACVGISIFVHAILNLTQKSKRTMFVNKKMSELFMQMKIKDDTQFLSMLENCYDQMDGDEGKMLQELKKQNVYRLVQVTMSAGDGNNSHMDCYKYCFEQVDQYNHPHHHNRKQSHLHEHVKVIAQEQQNDRQQQQNQQTNNKQQYPHSKQQQPLKQLHSRKSIKVTSFNNININMSPKKQITTTNRRIQHQIFKLQQNQNQQRFVQRKYQKTRQVTEFIKKYQVKRLKMGYQRRKSNINRLGNKIFQRKGLQQSGQWKQNIDEVILSDRKAATMPPNNKNYQKSHIKPKTLYPIIIAHLLTILHNYTLIPQQNFHLQQIKPTLSNILSILTKVFDFGYIYIYGSIYTLYAYSIEEYSNNRWILSFVNYHYVFLVALVGVVVYVGLIVYHKGEIVEGNLGVDQNQRTVSFTSIRYYTTFLLFLMGSSLSNLFILTTLNSYICDPTTNNLWNFPQNQCYTFIHYAQMFFSLLILLSYYPLASLIFPFSSAIDRTLEIKYKSQFQIVYLQCKFLVNGINVIFNQLDFQTQQLIKSITKTVLLLILTIMFYRMNPCSVGFVNKIQLKVYIAMVIINCSGVLCYFVGVKVTVIVVGLVIMLFVIYSIVMCMKHQPTGDSFQASQPVVVNTTTTDNNFGQFIKQSDPNTLLTFSQQLNNDSLVKLAPRSYGNKIINQDNNQQSLSIYQGSPVFYSRKKSMVESVNLEQTEVNSAVYNGSPKRSISPKHTVSHNRTLSPNRSISPSTTRISNKFNPVENINTPYLQQKSVNINFRSTNTQQQQILDNNNNNKPTNNGKKSVIFNTINLRNLNNIKNNKNFSKQQFKLSLRQSQMFNNNNTIISQQQLQQQQIPTINMTRARSTYLGDQLNQMSPTVKMMKRSSMSLVPQTRKVSITSNQ